MVQGAIIHAHLMHLKWNAEDRDKQCAGFCTSQHAEQAQNSANATMQQSQYLGSKSDQNP